MGIAARRYAQAAFQIAEEKGEIEPWRSDLRKVVSTLSDPGLAAILESPKVHFEEKAQLIRRCLPGVRDLILNLVYLLIVRRRFRLLSEILVEYERLADVHQGIEHAEVTTAVPLDRETEGRIRERLARLTGKKVMVSTKVDPELIGGFIARVGDELVDGSLRTRLRELREGLLG